MSREEKALLPSGSAVLTDGLLFEVDNLISNQHSLNERNFLALCTLLEALVLYENLFILGTESPSQKLLPELDGVKFIQLFQTEFDRRIRTDEKGVAIETPERHLCGRLGSYYETRARCFTSMAGAEEVIGQSVKDRVGNLALGQILAPTGQGKTYVHREMGMYAMLESCALVAEITGHKKSATEEFPEQLQMIRNLNSVVLGEYETSQITGVPLFSDPVLSIFHISMEKERVAVIQKLYETVCQTWEKNIENFYKEYLGLHPRLIPPIVVIILNRSNSSNDIIRRTLELRAELSELRSNSIDGERSIRQAKTLAEAFETTASYKAMHDNIVEKISRSQEKDKQLFGITWDIVKKGSPLGMLTEACDKLYEFDKKRRLISQFKTFVDIYNKATRVSPKKYPRLCERVFKQEFDKKLSDSFLDLLGYHRNLLLECPKVNHTNLASND